MVIALVLIDVIKSFFDPTGPNYYPEYDSILKNIKILLESARYNNVIIIHVMESHSPDNKEDFEWRKLPIHCISGSFEAEPAESIEILKGEYVVHKRRYSAFFATDLDLFLREQKVSKIVLAGVKTNVCIRATAQDAFALGYDVEVVKETVGSDRSNLHKASLEDIQRYIGRVISMEDCLTMFEEQERRLSK